MPIVVVPQTLAALGGLTGQDRQPWPAANHEHDYRNPQAGARPYPDVVFSRRHEEHPHGCQPRSRRAAPANRPAQHAQIIIDFVGACFVRDASEAKASRLSFIVKFFCKRVLAITSKAHPFSNPGEANNIPRPRRGIYREGFSDPKLLCHGLRTKCLPPPSSSVE